MILRRITEHVSAQNWFAVGIDFLINDDIGLVSDFATPLEQAPIAPASKSAAVA